MERLVHLSALDGSSGVLLPVVCNIIRNNFVRLHCDSCHQHALKSFIKIDEFCVALLILKMEGKKQICITLCFIISREVKKKKQLKGKKRFVWCMEKFVCDWMGQKWFAKFHAGDVSMNDAPWLGRLVEVDSDHIETSAESNQFYIMQEIADILKIFKSSIETHSHHLCFVNHFDVWILHKWKKTFLTVFLHAILYWNIMNDGNNNPVYETAKETLMYRTVFWILWERERVGWFGRMALKHV